jgi:phosphoglycolate phosphatase-like HAD superfamily hydrolase
MPLFSEYDLIIFDCDGVILNSNQLKIDAMENALKEIGCSTEEASNCTEYFAVNFGKSRFYHVDYFIEHFINMSDKKSDEIRASLLDSFSKQCRALYLKADETDGVRFLFEKIKATKCVASGSEQSELQEVFLKRDLNQYFKMILGSPVKKADLLWKILSECPYRKAVMIGDAISDLEAANSNGIDFIYYSPLSNVDSEMRLLCANQYHRVIDSFHEVLAEL